MENIMSEKVGRTVQTVNEAPSLAKFETRSAKSRVRQNVTLIICGLLIGLVNGCFGAGGGMLVVPVLTYFALLTEKQSHATAIAVILPLCLVSSVVYFLRGSYDTTIFAPTIIGVVIGGVLGAFALKKVSNVWLNFIFYGLMLFAGIKMLI